MSDDRMSEIPIGFALSLAMNREALDVYTRMGDAERDEIVEKSRQVKSKEEMERLVDGLGQDKYF
ncbi:hypothetical protein NE683_09780 [Bariatricus massiliensis]|uniref:Uncharacterized protein n=1 Tax=Bariatricus massiliensis TaxID=1745713 RepID=A0ABS8DDI4_9FIRM|nr:hypothetical protein [Bariatricus massiliensis]MCB7302592.1 hypothetical protein [Bariatricus massiliensis]MCB7373808.1 hypothetical protein [Bariatricus massiliensis]MCB7386478.1 hypothetical protein [Bariatricus massiliensis]MCB7410640.1 hypothetical protein [Bariatricus massiliensis]MCQ5253522.1 hypothetical protein [Bariatricus massiliensis]